LGFQTDFGEENILRHIFSGSDAFKEIVARIDSAIEEYNSSLQDLGLAIEVKNYTNVKETLTTVREINKKVDGLHISDARSINVTTSR